MKKTYSLDYSIERDVDRVAAIYDILDKLPTDPSPTELEQMGSYILYGKDEDGYNAAQRGEITNGNTRYNSYRKKDDKLVSLDAMLENPLVDQQQLKPATAKDSYTHRKPSITRPKYDKKTGEMIDPGDSDVPGMVDLWDSIDRMEHWIHVLEGKLPPQEGDLLFENSYRLYQLKHTLIDLRRHQYYLKDSYKPQIHFLDVDHPKAQFIDWTTDSFYWMPLSQWREKTSAALLHTISKNLKDYETRTNSRGEIEVKWVVRRHTFDWENPAHVRALLNNYNGLYEQLREKLDTYGRTLIFDFERYRAMANFSPVREFLIDKKIARTPYPEIVRELQLTYGLVYNENHLCTIYGKEIPDRIVTVAKRHRLLIETPREKMKQCYHCGRLLPRDTVFFSRNRNRKDGFSSNCKECEKIHRIEKRGQPAYDQRNKESTLHEVQTR